MTVIIRVKWCGGCGSYRIREWNLVQANRESKCALPGNYRLQEGFGRTCNNVLHNGERELGETRARKQREACNLREYNLL